LQFRKTYLTLDETGYFPKTLLEYIKGEPALAPFYEYHPDIKEFKKAIEGRKNAGMNRQLLADVLMERYKANAPDTTEAVKKNIESIASPDCFTVTTGHQLCLFTGPLFFIYKIITTINAAKRLREEYPNYHFVPVYWMASEDHDFAEINHAYLFGRKLEWASAEKTGGPVGNIPVSSLKSLLDELFAIMGSSPAATELRNIITQAYCNHATLSEAVFYLVDRLFGEYGLVIVDAANTRLKREFLPVICDELENQNSCKLVEQTNTKLKEAGLEPQIYNREINLFYIDGDTRNRIEKQGSAYRILNTNKIFTEDQIAAEAKASPEKFSPNVVLRPLYQQIILPNIAYVGGPSEIAYWLQLKGIFTHYKAAYPVLLPRCSALVIDRQSAERMNKLEIKLSDLFRDTEETIKEHVVKNSPLNTGFEEEKYQLKKIYDAMAMKIKQVDQTLVSLPEAELQKQYNAIKGMETKLIRAQKQKLENSVNQIRKLKEKLIPSGELQERHDNFIPFYLAYGKSFFSMLADNLDPFDFRFAVLHESDD
jgi:bacillithiol biosynthesis cysteine-adding enzyme BshC